MGSSNELINLQVNIETDTSGFGNQVRAATAEAQKSFDALSESNKTPHRKTCLKRRSP
jgi:hypothetical protein